MIIFILLTTTIFIRQKIYLGICYAVILCCGFLSYYCIYSLCQEITLHAQLETQSILLEQQQLFQEDYLAISKENKKILDDMREDWFFSGYHNP